MVLSHANLLITIFGFTGIADDSFVKLCFGSFASNHTSAFKSTFSEICSLPVKKLLYTFPLTVSGALPFELFPLTSIGDPLPTIDVRISKGTRFPAAAALTVQSAVTINDSTLNLFALSTGARNSLLIICSLCQID